MPYNPYQYFYGYDYMRPAAVSHVRIFHASPDAPPVDVYANDKIIARNLAYQQFTEYLGIPPGKYNIKVFTAGSMVNPVINTQVEIPESSIITVAAVGKLANIGLLPILDPKIQRIPGKVYLRVGHLSPDAPPVDVLLTDGTKLFSNVAYKKVSDYIAVNPGMYTVYINAAGTNQQVLYVPNINLMADRFYTVYVVGLASGQPSLQVVIPLDGNSYIQ